MNNAKSHILARMARLHTLQMITQSKSAHIGSAFSIIDILAVLYSGVARVSPETCESIERDVIILSKGHAAAAMYSILALSGFFPISELDTFCKDGTNLGGHITSKNNNGVEFSSGSLGHGLPFGIGIALSQKKMKLKSRTFVLLSDGECDEGTTWECALIASHFGLDNLFLIIDRNGLQSIKDTENTIALEPLKEKWEKFNWNVKVVDGHSHLEIERSIQNYSKPTCIIANTIKGKGVSFMENNNLWHYRSPNQQELEIAQREIEDSKHA